MMSTEELFHIRAAVPTDMRGINLIASLEGMDAFGDFEGFSVACNGDGDIVGFIHIEKHVDVAYVHPIAVYPSWRGYGVGRALMECAFVVSPRVALAARGGSVPFYRALGFGDATWEELDQEVVGECDGCELRDECKPQCMKIDLTG
jgi:N-acetylglutamate synthase-like GNAT family acetyltransferase